jgi:hypothetical protein
MAKTIKETSRKFWQFDQVLQMNPHHNSQKKDDDFSQRINNNNDNGNSLEI